MDTKASRTEKPKPRLGVFKFASCDGCQLTVLDCEEELPELAGRVDIAYFPEAIRRPLEGNFDVALVEGSVSTPEQEREIAEVRRRSRFLIALGACASHGGIQALRNDRDSTADGANGSNGCNGCNGNNGNGAGSSRLHEFLRVVYPSPQFVSTLARSRPASDYVRVDLELRGCPIDKRQLLKVLGQMLCGAVPRVPDHAMCLDCKRQHLVCVLVARGEPCMGPVTASGCGVLCPAYDRPCYSCFGPSHQANTASLRRQFERLGLAPDEIARLFQAFYSQAPEFKRVQSGGHAHD